MKFRDSVVVPPIGSMRFWGMVDGAGLANQAIQWAKGLALAHALDADVRLVHPLTSAHPYRRELGLSPWRSMLALAPSVLAARGRVWVPPPELVQTTDGKFEQRVRLARQLEGAGPVIVIVRPNHWGLFAAADTGLPKLRELMSPWLTPLVLPPEGPFRLVAHFRAGDFKDSVEPVSVGVPNRRWPRAWTLQRLTAAIRAARLVGGHPLVSVVSDDPGAAAGMVDELLEQEEIVPDEVYRPPNDGVRTDLATLTAADYLVPSGSTFSLLALALGTSGHCWHADHLAQSGGWGWLAPDFCPGGDEFGPAAMHQLVEEVDAARGIAVGEAPSGRAEVQAVARLLTSRRLGADARASCPRHLDLVRGGVVPILSRS